ncbi:HEAT repeat domain-containing protein [Rubinisphaera sp. JC750]|uniref:HEAT repeat domain-containing protein n=1 Tax=Rubinisphaera sp. JC750 TaxID=2898658 RepID=UPI001F2311D7|nr:HEAT repeat domain-containing protein [Rubinisphaera sp. JC750]
MDQVQILAEELTSESVTDRRRAARLMASLDEQAAPACVQLLHAVSDADEQVRNWVCECLENLGPPRAEDRATICNLACTGEADTRFLSLKVLGRLNEQAKDVASDLVARATDEQEPIVLTQLLKTMSRIAPADDETVNGCLKAHCAHADERVKSAAERLLSSRQ